MMRWRVWALGVLGTSGLLGLSLSPIGCSEPSEIVPAPMPGAAVARVPPAEKEGPQALGEPAMQAPVDASRKKAVEGTISPPTPIGESRTTPSGVTYETLKEGNGPEVKPGQTVTVHYTGKLTDGKVFDTTHRSDKDEPVPLEIGKGKVIAGWEEGIPGMKIGEVRKLTIPPELGYGALGQEPTIPPNATLIFEVEVLGAR